MRTGWGWREIVTHRDSSKKIKDKKPSQNHNVYILKNASTTKMKKWDASKKRKSRHCPGALSIFSQTSEIWHNWAWLTPTQLLGAKNPGGGFNHTDVCLTSFKSNLEDFTPLSISWKCLDREKGAENAIEPVRWELWFLNTAAPHSISTEVWDSHCTDYFKWSFIYQS